ncbi:hypothetical protein PTKIN_Ptkin11bG0157600 [Pterospermum kingtungense]
MMQILFHGPFHDPAAVVARDGGWWLAVAMALRSQRRNEEKKEKEEEIGKGRCLPVLGNVLKLSKVKHGMRCIKIPGVPHGSVSVFIRFLYSSCYEKEEVQKFVLRLLVLSHSYSVPALERFCICLLEPGWLTRENDGIDKRANPALEQELVGSVVEADTRKQERQRKMEEKKVYLQLYEAMEALLHICKDGCRTIGPRDKVLKGNQVTCNFPACKGLEALARHFSNCKTWVPGGCVHCKRMWQLLELHSRMCNKPDSCKVPLCRHFKEKMQQQSKKDETKWKLLVSKVIAAKNADGSFSSQRSGLL